MCRCAEVYYLCEGQLANTAATSQEREVEKMLLTANQGPFFLCCHLLTGPHLASCAAFFSPPRHCLLILGFLAPRSPFALLLILGRSAWFQFCGIMRESACQERRSYLLPPLTLPDTQPLIKPTVCPDRPAEQTELI